MDPEEDIQLVGRNVERGEITSVRPVPNYYGVSYSDVLILFFRIMKTDGICGNDEDLLMNNFEIHSIRSWLESPKKNLELKLYIEGRDFGENFFGLFTEIQPVLLNGKCYGLDLTFTCDSPYGYSDEHVETCYIDGTSDDVTCTFYNGSAEWNEYQYPVITIYSSDVFGDNETVSIINETDNKTTTITLPPEIDKLIIDAKKKTITDGDGNLLSMNDIGVNPLYNEYGYMSMDTISFNWPQFLYGDNDLIIRSSSGNSIDRIEISARDIIKSGGV